MTEPGHIRGRVFIAILPSTLAFAFVFWNLIPPTYLTNDDVAITRDLEGFIVNHRAITILSVLNLRVDRPVNRREQPL